MKPILVLVEHSSGAPRRASLEAIGAARAAGAEVGVEVWYRKSGGKSARDVRKAMARSIKR